ncbi:hypothetical protein C0993_004063 [Termitomyces sp. T159_Od127]|nr:hypothetical protein C0993_004063 [Termitomyces sp. T159_Od127]
MAFVQLPVELLDAICQHGQPTDLAVLSRTCSSVHLVAQRRLYRHLSISTASHNLQAVVTIAKKPELAPYVRTFSLRAECATTFRPFLQLVGTALSRMTELVSLDLFVAPDASWILTRVQCTYPRLSHFSCSFSFDGHVAEFLSKTEALTELEIDGASTIPVSGLPAQSIPHLSQFIGSSHVARAIVPGRPVESIQLLSGDLTVEDVIMLAKSTSHVLILGATTTSPLLPILDSLSQHMSSLVYLRLMTTCDFLEGYQPSFHEHTASALSSLTELKVFELGGLHWANAQKDPQDQQPVWQSQPFIAEDIDILFACYRMELSNKQAEAIVPDASKRQNALNFLLGVGLFKSLVDSKGSVSFRAVTKSELAATKDLTGEENLVLGHIKTSRNEGIWTKHLKAKTNLHQTVIDRCLKTLTQKRLIKRVPSVQHPTRKIYMLENLEPSVALTGGPWYTDNELDTEFIKHLSDACLKFIRDISFPKRHGDGVEGPLYALSNSPDYPSAEQIRNSLRRARLTETELNVEHVEMLLNVLVLDGEIERLPSFGTSMWNNSLRDDDSDEGVERSSKKRRKREDDGEKSRKKRKRSSHSDDEDLSADDSRKKSRRRAKDLSESDDESDDKIRHKKRKSKRSQTDSESSSSSDEDSSSRKRKSKKQKSRKSRDSSDSESSSDDERGRFSKRSKSLKRSSSPIRALDEFDTGGGGFVYRAIRQECPVFGASEAPCSQCPSFEFCKNGGPVNPRDCVYFGDWLVGGTVAAIEDGV